MTKNSSLRVSEVLERLMKMPNDSIIDAWKLSIDVQVMFFWQQKT